MPNISDDDMRALLATSKPYTMVFLKPGPNQPADRDSIVWEHGRRNIQLRADGRMVLVFPVRDGSDVNGVGVFDLDEEATREVMDGDPGVQAGVFVYELHPTRSFPGDALPA
jgi:hypothetical protein